MELVLFFQDLASTFLNTLADLFSFLGSVPFFVFIFAFCYYIYDKKFAYKLSIVYAIGFSFGSLFLKNIINRPRPYDVDTSIFAQRSAYSGSLPSASVMLASESFSLSFFETNKRLHIEKKVKISFLSGIFILTSLIGLSQIYLAQNYLFDVLVGIFLGFIISYLVFKFVKIDFKRHIYHLMFLPLLLGIMLVYSNQLFSNNFANSKVLEFVGLFGSIILGFYLENKYINYQVKNNLLFSSFKILFSFLIIIGYFYFCNWISFGILIFVFFKYFLLGLIITLLLPYIFKKFEKYLYVFSKDIDLEKTKLSKISCSEKKTKKIARQISKTIKNGDIILLKGDLGAGKTVVVRAILEEFGINTKITSPTFTLLNEYKTNLKQFYHFDFYRLREPREVENVGLEEILSDEFSIKLIEWPEKVKAYLPANTKNITLTKLSKKVRNIVLEEK